MPFLSNSFYRPIIGCTVAIVSALTLSACQPEKQQTITLQGETMGTTYTVKYLSDGQERTPLPPPKYKNALMMRLKKSIGKCLPTRPIPKSANSTKLRTVNQAMPISQDFAYVTGEALRLDKLTHGALDVTVGPLVNLWGFGPQKEITHEPTEQEIQHASEMVGTDKLKLSQDGQQPTLAKTHPEVYLDLSSIAKGFGVDKTAAELEKLNIGNYLVEIGGELHGKGHNAQGNPWRIGIEQPNIVQGGATQITIPLDNKSLATSGDYRIFHVDKSGRRLSHIINPKTKQPISHNLASISVVAENATLADGLSTGLFVLGETEALKLAEQENLAVFLIIRTPQGGYHTENVQRIQEIIKLTSGIHT